MKVGREPFDDDYEQLPIKTTMKFRADIQGLRAVAVLLVIANHFFPALVPGGYIGVDVFFVISGFIITQVLVRDQARPFPGFLLAFYTRRIRRILPAALLVIAASVAAGYHFLGPVTGADTARDGLFATVFLANFHFNSLAIDYFASSLPQPILQHYWSLAIEEQFYLVWPALFYFVARRPNTAMPVALALTLLSLSYSVVQVLQGSETAYFSSWTRVWELGAGVTLALLAKNQRSGQGGLIGLVVLAAVSLIYDDQTRFPGLPALVVVLATLAVLVFGENIRLLKTRVMVLVGDLSYILYLVHWPVLQGYRIYIGDEPTVAEKAGLLGLVFLSSFLINRFFENPIRYSATVRKFPGTTLVAGTCAIAGAALVFSLLGSMQ